VLAVFRVMVFNVMAHNRDDHVKNFAFIMDDDGQWSLAPAYDLNFAEGPGGEHTMTVADEGRKPTVRHMMRLATEADIPGAEAKTVIDEVRSAVGRWKDFARRADCRKSLSRAQS